MLAVLLDVHPEAHQAEEHIEDFSSDFYTLQIYRFSTKSPHQSIPCYSPDLKAGYPLRPFVYPRLVLHCL